MVTREADADGEEDADGVEEGTACEDAAEVWVDWDATEDEAALVKGDDDGIAGILLRVKGARPEKETTLDPAGINNLVTDVSPFWTSTWTTDKTAVLVGETIPWRWARFRG